LKPDTLIKGAASPADVGGGEEEAEEAEEGEDVVIDLNESLKKMIRDAVNEVVLENNIYQDENDEPASYNDLAEVVANDERLLKLMGRNGLTEQDLNSNSRKFFQFIKTNLPLIKKIGGFTYVKNIADIEVDWHYASQEVNEAKKKSLLKKKTLKLKTNLQKEAAYISRKINEGRELTPNEIDIIREIVITKAIHANEALDDKGWEHAMEGQQGMLDSYVADAVKYRSKADTIESLVDSILVTAEDRLGIKHADVDAITAQVEELWNRFPAKY
jgi:hypothetical protein